MLSIIKKEVAELGQLEGCGTLQNPTSSYCKAQLNRLCLCTGTVPGTMQEVENLVSCVWVVYSISLTKGEDM